MNTGTEEPPDTDQPPQRVMPRLLVTVLLPFGAGYYLSYLFRQINAIVADNLQADIGLSAGELGLLTSFYFLAFAAFQLPLGLLLDRYGPRRVNGGLLLIAALGAGLFAIGDSVVALAVARALIGLGVAGGLMASFKAVTQWFPSRRWALLNALILTIGGLGAITATQPVEMALAITSWRGVFATLAVVTVGVALTILVVTPERPREGPTPTLRSQVAGFATIFRDPFFWRLAPIAVGCMATSLAIQGLWAAPWLRDVAGLARAEIATTLLAMAIAMTVGMLLWGALADRLERHGIRLTHTLAAGVVPFLGAFAVITAGILPGSIWPWLLLALTSNVTALGYALVSRHFPLQLAGRANTALNLLVFVGAFGTQYLMGAMIELWPADSAGHHPPAAYVATFGVFWLACALAWCWFLLRARRAPFGGDLSASRASVGETATPQSRAD